MSDEPRPTSERARKRAAGKIRREELSTRRETYFDLMVSGYSVEQIASQTKKSPSAVRRAVGQALAKRRLDAPEDYARLQVARLTKALRCADLSLEEGDLKAIAPFVQLVRELNLYHGVNSVRRCPAGAASRRPPAAPLAGAEASRADIGRRGLRSPPFAVRSAVSEMVARGRQKVAQKRGHA